MEHKSTNRMTHDDHITSTENIQCHSKHFTPLRFSGNFSTTAKNVYTPIVCVHIYAILPKFIQLSLTLTKGDRFCQFLHFTRIWTFNLLTYVAPILSKCHLGCGGPNETGSSTQRSLSWDHVSDTLWAMNASSLYTHCTQHTAHSMGGDVALC